MIWLPSLVLGLAMTAPPVDAAPTASPSLVEAARAALLKRARESGFDVVAEPVGRLASLLEGGVQSVTASLPSQSWLRPRVPVTVTFANPASGRPTTATLWFAVSAAAPGAVYAADYPKGTASSRVEGREGTVDLARTLGVRPVDLPIPVSAGRLRRPVRTGQPVLPSDWEPVPAVQAQQRIDVEAVAGVVHISTQGTALADGDLGDLIPVLADHAAQPVQGRVVSPEGVRIEH